MCKSIIIVQVNELFFEHIKVIDICDKVFVQNTVSNHQPVPQFVLYFVVNLVEIGCPPDPLVTGHGIWIQDLFHQKQEFWPLSQTFTYIFRK